MATMAGLSGRAVGSAHEEINRSSSWPPEDRRIGAVEATNEPPATPATRLVGSTMMPRVWGEVCPLDPSVAEINAPLEDRPIGARLGPAPLPPPLAQAADTARPLAAEPDPSFTPDETSILRAIAEETEDAGHRLKSWSEEQAAIAIRQCKFARDMEENGERMIALSTKLKELAVVRERGVRQLGHDRDAAIYMEGFALGSSSSA